MLLYFKVKNFRSFRDEATLDMEAAPLRNHTDCLLSYGKKSYLPAAAIYGKNGGGKSNLIRAMWLAVKFICNAQKTQTEEAPVPVRPFSLNNYSEKEPTSFEFAYVLDEVKYVYGFSATREYIVSEYLKSWPKGKEKSIFSREYQEFTFPKDGKKRRKQLISEAVAPNQLYFVIACAMNYQSCLEAMRWFRECIVFTSDYPDINRNLFDYHEDEEMLKAIESAARTADVGIQSIKFEIENKVIDSSADTALPENARAFFKAFKEALRQTGYEAEMQLNQGKLKSTTYHAGLDAEGDTTYYPLTLSDESGGTRKLMTLAPAIEQTLAKGGVLVVDELECQMHQLLVEYVLSRYQEKASNQYNAQIIFTTHETALLNQEILRRDQIYFVDKSREDGASSLYSLVEFNIRIDTNILTAYLLGKFGAIPEIEEVF